MPTIIKMPSFSATMETGKLLSWLVAPGDAVVKGQALAEIETDKAVTTIEAPDAGQIVQLLVTAGDNDVPVNAGLAVMRFEDESMAATPAVPEPQVSVTSSAAQPEKAPGTDTRQRVRASPAVRAIARAQGLDLSQVIGTGPSGRIVRTDLGRATTQAGPATAAASPAAVPPAAAAPPAAQPPGAEKAVDRAAQLRVSMARALVHAKATVPHFYAEVDICVDVLMAHRRQVVARYADRRSPTITAYLIRAAALALREVPAANRYWSTEGIQHRSACHIGCAVGITDRVALPVVRNVDGMTVDQVNQELLRLSSRARTEMLTQQEMGDASLTISNLGMHGIDRFFPIINVPEALILGIGQARRAVGVVNDLIGIRTMVSCTASADHRVVDGELLGRFMQAFRRFIENPQQLDG